MTDELQNILDKVEGLYNKFGIKSVTMDDIARELGMSKKTLYQYVQDKHDLVRKVVHYSFSKRANQIREIMNQNQDAIQEVNQVYHILHKFISEFSTTNEYDLKKYYPDIFKEIKNMRKKEMENFLLQNIEKGKKHGVYRSEIQDEIIAQYQSSILLNLSENELLTSAATLSEGFLFEIIDYHLHAIVNDNGLQKLKQIN